MHCAGRQVEAPRRRRDRRAASACSRRRPRRRGSRPRESRCGARDRPSARCCRWRPARAGTRLSAPRPGATSGQASSRCQARLRSASVASGSAREAEARQDALEVAPVQHVELAERDAAGAHLLHGGLVFAAPGVREGEPVEGVAERREDASRLRARSPVRQSTSVPNTSKKSALTSMLMRCHANRKCANARAFCRQPRVIPFDLAATSAAF